MVLLLSEFRVVSVGRRTSPSCRTGFWCSSFRPLSASRRACLSGEVTWDATLAGRLQGAFAHLADELAAIGVLHVAHAHHAVSRRAGRLYLLDWLPGVGGDTRFGSVEQAGWF
jgi:hypothetical protein